MLSKLMTGMRALLWKSRVESELDEEMQFHLEKEIEKNLDRGMTAEEAHFSALRSFGAVDQLKEECRDARGVRLIEEFVQDVRFGVRMLIKNRGITFVVVLALAMGIGANSAIFSVVNAVILRPLPYEEADRLVYLTERSAAVDEMPISYPNFIDWQNQNHVFEYVGVYNRNSYNLSGEGEAERIPTAQASADLFKALRVSAVLGRLFTNEEDKPGATPVVVLSYALWQRRFGGQANILNQALTLNGKSYTVIGVMPQGFQYPSRVDMWVPAGQLSADWQHRANHPGLFGIARLKPGVTLAQAQADMDDISANLATQYPDFNAGLRVRIQPLLEVIVGNVRRTLEVLFAAVGFVLLIACANIANLLLARSTTRQKELAVRKALGARRTRIARQLLTESLLLALIGGTFGFLLARWGVRLILYVSPNAIPRADEIGLDWRVLAFALGISLLTGILFGLAPAIQANHVDINETLKQAGRGTTTREWLRDSLVVVEVATTLVLLAGAGLMVRSFYRLQKVDPGFSVERVSNFSVSLPPRKYIDENQRIEFFQRLLERIRGLPGVEKSAVASCLPLNGSTWETPFVLDGQPLPPRNATPVMQACSVTPDYFRALSIPLLQGRYFDQRDDRSHLAGRDLGQVSEGLRGILGVNVVIIDEDFARRYWPEGDAIGKRIRFGTDQQAPLLTIVGLVGRVRMEKLSQDSNRVQAYFSFAQLPFPAMGVFIKSSTDPSQIAMSVREQVKTIDPTQPIYNFRTMDEIRTASIAPERLNLTLLSLFAGLALILTMVGIYGVMSYSVSQRTQELGIRMALGAKANDVLKLVLRKGMRLALIGSVIGLLGAFALTRLMTGLLFAVSPRDETTFVVVTVSLMVVAVVACLIPAWRATRVDPLIALRYE